MSNPQLGQRMTEGELLAWYARGERGPPYPDMMPTYCLETSVRVANVLKQMGLHYVVNVRQATDAALCRLPNFGKVSLAELRALVPYDPAPGLYKFEVNCCRCGSATMAVAHPDSNLATLTKAFCQPCTKSYEKWFRRPQMKKAAGPGKGQAAERTT